MQHRLFLLFCVGASLICGCAGPGHESYKIGLELEKQNRLEESYCLLEEAVNQSMGSSEYSEACLRVKEGLISQHLKKANGLLETTPLTFGHLQQASGSVEKALKLDPAKKEVVKLKETITGRINEMILAAEKLNKSATAAVEGKEWKYAIDKLKEVQGFYPDYPGLSDRLATTVNQAVAYYLNEAETMRSDDDFAGAIDMLVLGKEIDPANLRIEQTLSELTLLNTPETYLTKAAEFARQSEWVKTAKLIRRAKELNPGADMIARLEKLQSDGVAFFHEKSLSHFKEGDIYSSYDYMASALSLKDDLKQDPRYGEFLGKLIAALEERGDSYENAGRLGNSLMWYEKAHKLAGGGQRGIYPKIQAARDKIKQRVVKKIAVMDFSSPVGNQDAGRLVTDSLLSNLTKNASGDVKIFARDVLGALLKEIELGQAGLYDIQSAKKAGKLKGTDILIFGSVNQCSVEKSVEDGQKMVNAVVGKKSIINPAYQAWAAVHPEPSKKELEQAPPQIIEEEVREIVKYKVATHRKNANVVISFRLIDVEEGEVVLSKKLANNEIAQDTYSEGVDFANIPFKELTLPSDSALLEQVMEKTIAELGYGVLSRFQNLQVVYSDSAQMLKKRGEYEKSIEKFVDAMLVEEVKNVATDISENSRKEIERLLKTVCLEKVAAEKAAAEAAAKEAALQRVSDLANSGAPPVRTELPVQEPAPGPDAKPALEPVAKPALEPNPQPAQGALPAEVPLEVDAATAAPQKDAGKETL